MTVTAKDLRFNISMLFDVLSKGEEIIITYRGKPKARLVPDSKPNVEPKNDRIFGMWRDQTDSTVDATVRTMREGRRFDP